MNATEKKKKGIDCFKCDHFDTTWDKSFPRGCSVYGFKTKNLPSIDVFNNSGIECQMFISKEKDS